MLRSHRSGLFVLALAVAVTVVAGATGLSACSSSDGGGGSAASRKTTTTTLLATTTSITLIGGGQGQNTRITSGCLPAPAKAPTPAWYPADLPLPPGSYASKEVQGPPVAQAFFVVPTGLVGYVQFVNREWAAHGWTQGRGEAEQGEAENSFARIQGDRREGGAWRAREAFCDTGMVELLLVYKQESP